jgi:hypothetical protein
MIKFFTKACASDCLLKIAGLLTFIALLVLVVTTYNTFTGSVTELQSVNER